MLVALALGAQAPAPDTARQGRYERVLNGIADSLDVVRGALTAFPLDLERTSTDLVLARATRVRNACHGATVAVDQVTALLAEGTYAPRAKAEQLKLQDGSTALRRSLAQCDREWTVHANPTQAEADTLRAWGPYRGSRLDDALRGYLGLVREFMKQAALKKPAAS